MMRSKFLSAILVGIFSVGSLLAAKEPLRVGVSPTDPPIQFMKGNKVDGLESDFAKELEKELGRDVKFVELKFSQLIPSLLTNQIDVIMAGMSVTPLRSLQIAFAEPYMKIGQMALVRTEDRGLYKDATDVILTEKSVGTLESTTGQFLLLQEFSKAKKRFYSSSAQGAGALLKKEVDLFILDSPYIYWQASKNKEKLAVLPFVFTQEDIAWAVRKTDDQLLDLLNGILRKWKASGRLDETIEKWIPDSQVKVAK